MERLFTVGSVSSHCVPGAGEWAAAWTLPAMSAAFVVLAAMETRSPRDGGTAAGLRWVTNFGLFGAVLGCVAVFAPHRLAGLLLGGWSGGPLALLGQHASPWLVLAVSLLLLDALSYALHRLQHLRPLWRFHAVHHADEQVDLTTGLRHHPGEALVNAAIGGVVLTLLGLPPWAAAAYGMLAPIFDMWTHVNFALPPRLERMLSAVIVTPGVHRIHHSDDPADYGANFGGILTIWDRIFSTWRPPTQSWLRFGLGTSGLPGLLQALIAPFWLPQKQVEPDRQQPSER